MLPRKRPRTQQDESDPPQDDQPEIKLEAEEQNMRCEVERKAKVELEDSKKPRAKLEEEMKPEYDVNEEEKPKLELKDLELKDDDGPKIDPVQSPRPLSERGDGSASLQREDDLPDPLGHDADEDHDTDDIDADSQASNDLFHLRIPPLSAMSPCFINRLSDEILSAIFRYADDDGWKWELKRFGAYIFYRVCRRWRTITSNTPELWTYIRVTDHFRDSKGVRAKAWLSHAGSLPLDVEIESPKNRLTDLDPLLGIFAGHMDRIKFLTLSDGFQIGQPTLLHWPKAQNGIRKLVLGIIFRNVEAACDVLRSCPVLQELDISHCHGMEDGRRHSRLQPVKLPSLHTLVLDFSLFIESLLPFLHAPHLENANFPDNDNGIAYSNIERESMPFSRLRIYLDHLPPVDFLWLEAFDETTKVFKYLGTPKADGHFPCPHLNQLEFVDCDRSRPDLMSLVPRYVGIPGEQVVLPRVLGTFNMESSKYVKKTADAAVHIFQAHGTTVTLDGDDD